MPTMKVPGLRSRKDTLTPCLDHDDDDGDNNATATNRRSISKSPSSSMANQVFFCVGAFILFVVFLKVTAPPPHERYAGMEMQNIPHKSMFKEGRSKQVQKVSRRGHIVHKAITSVNKDDLKGIVEEITEDVESITYEEAIEGRERLIDILADAGVEELDVHTIMSLPKWSSVTRLYGEGPVVIGLETCQKFRETTPLDDASIGTAGMFNTGTNPFAMYIQSNCKMPHNTHDKHGGTRWQVPWGKHTLASRKWNQTAGRDEKVNKTNVLPIVIVRDPYFWMQSMCTHPYAAKWPHSPKHCPNLVPNADDFALPLQHITTPSIRVNVSYNPPVQYDSLAHYWTQWYKEYLEADYPRLIVRFEDLQFNVKEMINLVCECAGAVPRDRNGEFTYVVDSGKWGPGHRRKQTNLISAMIKYGSDAKRFAGMTKEDLEYAATAVDPEMMQLFKYEIPSI